MTARVGRPDDFFDVGRLSWIVELVAGVDVVEAGVVVVDDPSEALGPSSWNGSLRPSAVNVRNATTVGAAIPGVTVGAGVPLGMDPGDPAGVVVALVVADAGDEAGDEPCDSDM